MKFSIGFCDSVLMKVLAPESRRVYQVAREADISASKIQDRISRLQTCGP